MLSNSSSAGVLATSCACYRVVVLRNDVVAVVIRESVWRLPSACLPACPEGQSWRCDFTHEPSEHQSREITTNLISTYPDAFHPCEALPDPQISTQLARSCSNGRVHGTNHYRKEGEAWRLTRRHF